MTHEASQRGPTAVVVSIQGRATLAPVEAARLDGLAHVRYLRRTATT